ncbi:MAG: hypothetical protein MI919_28390, partial [Holophagales bacterium]|nr:hypothetical protein [Holophagales bacterium]
MTLPTLFWADLTLVVLFFLALPIYYARIQSNTMAALARGERSRGREYAEILAVLWMATAALGAIWIFLGRSPAALGLGGSSAGGAGAWLGWGLTALGTAYFAYCAKAVVSNEDAVEQIRRDTRDLKELLPHDRRELAG